MSNIITDNISGATGDLLSAHHPDNDATANYIAAKPGNTIKLFRDDATYGGVCTSDTSDGTGAHYYMNKVMPDNNCSLRIGIKTLGAYNPSGNGAGIFGDIGGLLRIAVAGTFAGNETLTGYRVYYRLYNNTIQISRLDADTTSNPGNTLQAVTDLYSAAVASPLVAGAAVRYFDITCVGTNPTVITVKEGATVLATFSDNTAKQKTVGTKFGVYANTVAGNDPYLDYFSADSASTADTTAPTMTGTMSSSGVTATGYTLDWSGTARSDNVAIGGYQHSPDGATWTDVGNVTNKPFTGKAASTIYPNYVRAYDTATPRNYSTPALFLNVTTSAPSGDTTAPNLSGSITADTVTATTAQFSWPAGTDNVAVDHYRVSKDGGATWLDLTNVLTYTFTGLTPSTTYARRVQAVDAAGNVSASLADSFTTGAAAAGSFTTDAWTSSGTLRANQAFTGTWYHLGVVGSAGGTPTLVSGTLSAAGVATLTGLTAGAGFLIGATADGGRFYQEGTVA